jgi:dTDP-glucose 4,6-dehydratase
MNRPAGRTVLVTGGAGFIGSNFIRWLLGAEPAGSVRIVDLDALTYAGSLENLKGLADPGSHVFVRGDIGDRELVAGTLREHRIDTIVHFAAETHVDRSIHGAELFVRTNVLGTLVLLEEARRYWLEDQGPGLRFHHISTDEVFGSLKPGEAAWTERAPYAPNSPYAASKAASDHLVRAFGHTHGLPYTITNCSNNYGPRQFPEKLIPLMIANALEGRELPVYGDGRQVRDWLYVEDHCEAIWRVVTDGRAGETYNVGGAADPMPGRGEPSNLEIVEMLCRILDEARPGSPHGPHRRLVRFVADRPGHDRRYAIDSSKIRGELSWRPRHTLEEGLRKTVAWYLAHPEWIDAIRKQGNYGSWLERNYGQRGGQT